MSRAANDFLKGCTATCCWGKYLYLSLLSPLINIAGGSLRAGHRGKLTSCERDLAINLPSCFRLLFLLSSIRKTKNARLKNPTDLLHKNLMNYPCIVCHLTPIGKFQCSFIQIILSITITILDVNALVV